ncbi:MAG: hypothetical protein MUE36_15675 [Acidimicrobiales bacterium]|jgi:hypothetical protein|nr:hypothetical protein [Acidimicrobiales bacterium]
MPAARPESPAAPTDGDHWEVVDAGPVANSLRDELLAAAGPTHLLHGADAEALIRCRRCRAVGFHLRRGRFAIVELSDTSVGTPAEAGAEPAVTGPSGGPAFQRFATFAAFRESLARHRHPRADRVGGAP